MDKQCFSGAFHMKIWGMPWQQGGFSLENVTGVQDSGSRVSRWFNRIGGLLGCDLTRFACKNHDIVGTMWAVSLVSWIY